MQSWDLKAETGAMPEGETPRRSGVIDVLGAIVDGAVVALGATIIVLVFTNVLSHLVYFDIAWTTEFSEVLMVWVTFLGGAAATRRAEHVGITELVDRLPARFQQWVDGFAQLGSATILGVLIWYSVGIVEAGWTSRLTVLDWPMSVEYLALPVSSAITLVFVLADLRQIAMGRTRRQRYEVER